MRSAPLPSGPVWHSSGPGPQPRPRLFPSSSLHVHQPSSPNPLIWPHPTFPSLTPTFFHVARSFQLPPQTSFLPEPCGSRYQRPLPAPHHFRPLPLSSKPDSALVSLPTVKTALLAPPAPAGSAECSPRSLHPSPPQAAGPAGYSGASSSPGPRPGWSPPSPRFTGCSCPPPLACLRPSACISRCAQGSQNALPMPPPRRPCRRSGPLRPPHPQFQPRLKRQRQTALRTLIGPLRFSKSGPRGVARRCLSSDVWAKGRPRRVWRKKI